MSIAALGAGVRLSISMLWGGPVGESGGGGRGELAGESGDRSQSMRGSDISIVFQSAALTAWANTWTLELHHREARCDAPSSRLP